MNRATMARAGALVVALLGAAARAPAQEPINATDSATQPSPGQVILKEQARFFSLKLDHAPVGRRGEVEDVVLLTSLNVGITTDVALSLRAPVVLRKREFQFDGKTEREQGIGDLTILAKWRIYRHDSAALDTARLSLVGGAQIRTGDEPFTSDAYNPVLGLAYTQIAGRHGLNAALQWTFTTGGNDEPLLPGESTADLLRYDLAYLFRVSPKQYAADTHGAFYALLEVNGFAETNGDHELFVAPGLMYEAKTWVLELAVQIPVWQRIEQRAETDYAVVAGVRLFW